MVDASFSNSISGNLTDKVKNASKYFYTTISGAINLLNITQSRANELIPQNIEDSRNISNKITEYNILLKDTKTKELNFNEKLQFLNKKVELMNNILEMQVSMKHRTLEIMSQIKVSYNGLSLSKDFINNLKTSLTSNRFLSSIISELEHIKDSNVKQIISSNKIPTKEKIIKVLESLEKTIENMDKNIRENFVGEELPQFTSSLNQEVTLSLEQENEILSEINSENSKQQPTNSPPEPSQVPEQTLNQPAELDQDRNEDEEHEEEVFSDPNENEFPINEEQRGQARIMKKKKKY
jgi:hypothetical protein